MNKSFAALAILSMIGASAAPASGVERLPVDAGTDGAALFAQKCTACHETGAGKEPRHLGNVAKWPSDALTKKVESMQSKRGVGLLTPVQISALVTFLRSQ